MSQHKTCPPIRELTGAPIGLEPRRMDEFHSESQGVLAKSHSHANMTALDNST